MTILSVFAVAAQLSFLALSAAQEGKGTVQGLVRDSTTGETLGFANVQIEATRLGSSTNLKGYFVIKNVPTGAHIVTASYVGYSKSVKRVIVSSNETKMITFFLKPESIELKQVEVFARRYKRADETTISLHLIGPKEIKAMPHVVEPDILRLIQSFPGVSSTSDVTSQFYVRGGSGDQNLILLNGVQIYNPFHALSLFSAFDSDAIEYAEFYTGGYGAEYGSRLSSVLNVATRQGNNQRVKAMATVTSLSGKALLEGPIPALEGSWMLDFRKSYRSGTLRKFLNHSLPLSFYDAIGTFNVWMGEAQRFTFTAFASGDDVKNVKATEPDYSWRNYAFGLNYAELLTPGYYVDVTISRSIFEGKLSSKESAVRPISTRADDIHFSGSVTTYLSHSRQINVGLTFRFPEFENQLVNAANFDVKVRGTVTESGLWLKYKWIAERGLSGELGVRTNFHLLLDETESVPEPRISLKYTLSPLLTFRAAVGRYYQQLSTITNEDDVLPLFEMWISESGSQPARADHYIVGVESTPGAGSEVSLQGYYKKFHDLITYNRDKIDDRDRDFSPSAGKSFGAELFIRKSAQQYSFKASYTLSWAFKEERTLKYPPRYDQRHAVDVEGLLSLGEGWQITTRWELASGLPFTRSHGFYDRLRFSDALDTPYYGETGYAYTVLGPKNKGRLPPYHRLDVGLSKELHVSFVTLLFESSVVNVYGRKNVFYFNRKTGERVDQLPFLVSFGVRARF